MQLTRLEFDPNSQISLFMPSYVTHRLKETKIKIKYTDKIELDKNTLVLVMLKIIFFLWAEMWV